MAANDYARIEKAIDYLTANYRAQPGLKTVARHVGLSEFHLQRLFRRFAGISPKRFVQYLTADHARALLANQCNVLEASGAAGLSGAGRLHDLMVNLHAATPGEIRARGAGLVIRYGFHDTPFGDCLLALTERGVCALRFVDAGERAPALKTLRAEWPRAMLKPSPQPTRTMARRIFAAHGNQPINLYVAGTNFQMKVWEALLRLPPGRVATYETMARAAGRPGAVRAAANAVAHNPIGWLIPCHRVIRKTGLLGGYRWGTSRKRAMLAWEASRHESDTVASDLESRQR